MPYDFNIYHSQVTPSIPDYDTVSVLVSSDLANFATIPYVNNFGDNRYLSLNGGSLSGDLILNNQGGIAKNLILNSPDGIPIAIRAGITFVSSLCSETGIVIPGLLITDGRLDITPDNIFNRAEFRIKGNNTQFNIFNINTFDFYMRVNSDTSFMVGRNTTALSAGAFAEGVNTQAIGQGSHAGGLYSTAAHQQSWIWKGDTSTAQLSTTRTGQFMVSAAGGISLNTRVGIGTDSVANALTVVGRVSATDTVFSSGAPVVVSSPRFETTTTNISSISNIVTLSQATYNALTIKQPTTLYVII
jgi:hypothetical protein